MSNKIILFTLITLIGLSCSSPKNATTKVEEDVYQKLDNALAWKIEGKALSEPSYLFGTMHIIPSDSYFLPQGVEQAFSEANKIVFEIDMNEMSDMGAMMGLFTKAFMKDNTSLKDLMTSEEYDLVSNHFDKVGLPMMFLEKIKPMFLTIFASTDFSPDDLQNGQMKSYETEFFELANAKSIPVSGLESLEYQMSIFDSIPYKVQADMLLETIRYGQGESDELEKTIKLYTAQNIEAMYSLMDDEDSGLGEYNDLLLNDRNKNWIPKMESLMNQQSTFFAVGAGHLAGEEGVIHLLRKKGYQISVLRQEI